MRRDEVVNAVRAQPFRPFRLHIADGTTYDVRHPEMLMVTRNAVVVGILDQPENGNSGPAYPPIERSTTVDLFHVTQIEELAQSS